MTGRGRSGYARRQGQRFQSLEALKEATRIGRALRLPPEAFEPLRDEAIACLALPDLEPTGQVLTLPPGVIALTFDASMTRYAVRFRDGTVSVRQIADDREIARFHARGQYEPTIFELSPDGRYLAARDDPDGVLTVWDIDRRAVALEDPGPISFKIAAGSARTAAGSSSPAKMATLLAYDLATGGIVRSYRGPVPACRLAIRPDGGRIAALYDEKPPTCRLLDVETGRVVQTIRLSSAFEAIAWSPDGTTLAIPDHKQINLWDAGTGIRRATLEGHTSLGLSTAFHPAGTLLASGGWEARTWLWDPVLGRPWLKLSGGPASGFSRDGRIVVGLEDQLTWYRVDPALEYRTFAHASREAIDYGRPSVRLDGRLLAVGTDRGAMIWDLAHGIELAFLPIGNAWNLMFEPSGDLITSGSIGVQRWPIRLDAGRGEFQIGPPRRLPLPASLCGIAEDRSGRIVALGNQTFAYVATPERTDRVGPLDDCRGVSPSVRTGSGWRPAPTPATVPRSGASPTSRRSRTSRSTMGRRCISAPTGNGWRPRILHAGSGKSGRGARCCRSAATSAASPATAG